MIELIKGRNICLGPTRAAIDGEGAECRIANTQIVFTAPAAIEWQVSAAQDMAFRAYINMSASKPSARGTLTIDGQPRPFELTATQGVFPTNNSDFGRNFERFPLGGIFLKAGEHTVRVNVDALPEGCRLSISSLWLEPCTAAWPAGRDYGVMIHWTAQSAPREGEKLPYAEAVERFDIPRIVDELEDMGAQYLVLTSMLCTSSLNLGCSIFSAMDSSARPASPVT